MLNKAMLIGHLGKDPQISELQSGVKVARFTVATSESYKDKNGDWQSTTEWHNIVAWDKLAGIVEKILKKGTKAYIEGKIMTRKYTDQGGTERSITEIRAMVIQKLDKHDGSSDSSDSSGEPTTSATSSSGIDDDLPF